MDFYDYESRLARPVKVKLPDFKTGERLHHVVFAAQFNRELIDKFSRIADKIRLLAKSKDGHIFLNSLLPHKRAMLYFTQPSTRTFLSFTAACQILGITCNEVRDRTVSSESKGESPFDSMRMFSSYFDVVIMRSVLPQFAECCAYMMNDLSTDSQRNVPIVNGGSGADEHPTQALLDMYTIQRVMSFYHAHDSSHWTRFGELRESYPELTKGITGKTFGFCGDICRGRTIRSLVEILSNYANVSMFFVNPPHQKLALPSDLKARLVEQGVNVREFESFRSELDGKPMISQLDCLYMTRIQKEHNTATDDQEFQNIDFSEYKLTKQLVAQMKTYAPILHPFPRDQEFGEIPPAVDNDSRAYYFRQARNGMWIRAALLAYLFDVDGEINDYFDGYTR